MIISCRQPANNSNNNGIEVEAPPQRSISDHGYKAVCFTVGGRFNPGVLLEEYLLLNLLELNNINLVLSYLNESYE